MHAHAEAEKVTCPWLGYRRVGEVSSLLSRADRSARVSRRVQTAPTTYHRKTYIYIYIYKHISRMLLVNLVPRNDRHTSSRKEDEKKPQSTPLPFTSEPSTSSQPRSLGIWERVRPVDPCVHSSFHFTRHNQYYKTKQCLPVNSHKVNVNP